MQLTEQLLQYIWLHRYYNGSELKTEEGMDLTILAPGSWNRNAGPDFLNGKIKVGNTILAGHIELHLKSSDWIRHGHRADEHYKNLILHVVYEADVREHEELPPNVPTLVLKDRISRILLEKYARLMNESGVILCAGQLDQIEDITWTSWKDRLMVERWQTRTALFAEWMEDNQNDWTDTFYRALARNFGLPVNGEAFAALAASLPLKVLGHYKNKPAELEALLFGQASFLEIDFEESYPNELKEIYHYLKKKYQLKPVPGYLWKWAKMRPASFPTFRIAQFAALIGQSTHLFSKILEVAGLKELKDLFDVKTHPYWETHYRFDKKSAKHPTNLGKNKFYNILINTICPILAMYDQFQLDGHYLEQAFQWMKEIPPERNRLTREWEKIGIANENAWDSQSLIHLIKNYCAGKRCLECAIGYQLLKTK